jgi:hypothetical protein
MGVYTNTQSFPIGATSVFGNPVPVLNGSYDMNTDSSTTVNTVLSHGYTKSSDSTVTMFPDQEELCYKLCDQETKCDVAEFYTHGDGSIQCKMMSLTKYSNFTPIANGSYKSYQK